MPTASLYRVVWAERGTDTPAHAQPVVGEMTPQAAGQPERFLCITYCVRLPCLTRNDVPRPCPLPSRSWPASAGRLQDGEALVRHDLRRRLVIHDA
jgi:hypothetical protein